jgi:ParB/RepB/Spo0J family partition protein
MRELTDAEVLEVQVVENLQRADLHELEEAEGYEQLLKCAHADGKKYTVEEIAAKVGKSRSYVFARLKLTALCPEARKAFYDGNLDASKGSSSRASATTTRSARRSRISPTRATAASPCPIAMPTSTSCRTTCCS